MPLAVLRDVFAPGPLQNMSRENLCDCLLLSKQKARGNESCSFFFEIFSFLSEKALYYVCKTAATKQ